jgi:hypothetical protein
MTLNGISLLLVQQLGGEAKSFAVCCGRSRRPSDPTHSAYTVIKREGKEDYWLNLGVAFARHGHITRLLKDPARRLTCRTRRTDLFPRLQRPVICATARS